MTDRDTMHPPSSRDVAGEDFLFHLYRGSEMLQEDRVHDAKAELEQALSLQPRDSKGQDLLAIVYFRLGLYPRAIAIYERLVKSHPAAITPRVNLALCYLKTAQAAHARTALEEVLALDPKHSRAWGYLGLAFQRLGDFERASHAFATGGHDAMARRLLEMASTTPSPSIRPDSLAPDRSAPAAIEIEGPRSEATSERAHGHIAIPPHAPLPSIRTLLRGAPTEAPGPCSTREPHTIATAPPSQPISVGVVHATAPVRALDAMRQRLLVFPRDLPVAKHTSGLVLVQTAASFAARLEHVRSMSAQTPFASQALPRRTRGRSLDEPLGGAASPLHELIGRGELVLGPTAGRQLTVIGVEDEALYLREDVVSAFETSLVYENGRLPVGDGEAVAMLQLRGRGAVIASFPEPITAIEVTADRTAQLRAHAVLGWLGRLVPRALSPSESPATGRGLISFSGEGMVLVDAR